MEAFETRIAAFPRVDLMALPTPIQRLHRVEAALGDVLRGVRLFAKRDDLMGLGGGGNKVRKLEFLMGDALKQGADTVITVGGRQSNHARLTAAAAARLGLRCELMLAQMVDRHDEDYQNSGNVLLDDLFGAVIHNLPAGTDMLKAANDRADTLRSEGRDVYVAPSGGSSPIGCLGYAACAAEIIDQSAAMGVAFDRVIVPNGSSGTHAGLAAGFIALGHAPSIVRSFTVLADKASARATTIEKVAANLALLGPDLRFDETQIDVDGSQRGSGYGVPTQQMLAAVRLMAAHEGLLLDPVYSGKAFAGLLAGVRNGDYSPGANLLFVMTGGTPGLYAYRAEFAGGDAR